MSTLPSQPADESWTVESLPPLGSDPAIRASTPAVILEAQDTFLKELPELLKERPGQWVAYYGQQRIGFGPNQMVLWQECVRQGYSDFLTRRIEPCPPVDYISAL